MKRDADSENQQPGRQTHVIASPNPTIEESDAPAAVPTPPVTSTKVEATTTTKQTPLKKPRQRTTKPRSD